MAYWEQSERNESERSEAAIREVFDNQFPSLTNQMIFNMRRISMVGDKWPPVLMVLLGGALTFIPVAITIGIFGDRAIEKLDYMEFIALVIAGAGLVFFGALFSLYQGWSLRRIIVAQQRVGTEILTKQIDIERDMLKDQRKRQGQLILLPAKKLRHLRCR